MISNIGQGLRTTMQTAYQDQEDTTGTAVTNENFTPKRRGEGCQGTTP